MVALERVQGAYSLLLMTDSCLVAARDPNGFRPLLLGDYQGRTCFASESVAMDLLDVGARRELEPGEVVVARNGSLDSFRMSWTAPPSRCAFELVYFSRPDSVAFGESVSKSRMRAGACLAREAPAVADLVVAVPDSGLFAALGYARESGLPLEFGLIRNHYVGRTFIQPKQSIRHFGVRVKLNPVREIIEDQRVVLITAWPCHYGIDMPTREELIASSHTVEEIRRFIGADSLAYLSLEGTMGSMGGEPKSYCTACWTGRYPVALGEHGQSELFPARADED